MIDLTRLLPKMLKASASNPAVAEIAAKLAWSQAAGAGMRRHAVAFRLHQKTLIVSVADVVWQKQLQAMSSELIFRINRFLNHEVVDFIEFRIDPATVESARAEQSPVKEPIVLSSRKPITAELIDAAASISDHELRERFIGAARNCIERHELRARSNPQSEFRNPKSSYAN